jgi:Rrf2 family transcriptional regulator, iron-sulfur cluster assembly transcription factor
VRLTTKGRYAVTAMLDLAYHSEKHPVTLTDIAKRQEISLSYLEQLFSRLRKAGMVEGVRGPGGGYQLSRKADLINIADIIAAVDETLDSTRCGGKSNCQSQQPCLTHDLWMGLSDQIRQYLSSISLLDVLQRKGVRQVARRQDQQLAASAAAAAAAVESVEVPLRRDIRTRE